MLDYPDKTSCILWFAGCNMRCQYCYNPEVVRGKGHTSYDAALQFIKTRKDFLDAVVLSGGECTMHQHMDFFLKEIKNLGFLLKIDTNGSHPERIKHFILLELVDYIALDFKALPSSFHKVTQSDLFQKFEQSLKLLIKMDFPFEVRTTVHSAFLDPGKISEMIRYLEEIGYTGTYYLQNTFHGADTLGNIGESAYQIGEGAFHSSHFKIKVRN